MNEVTKISLLRECKSHSESKEEKNRKQIECRTSRENMFCVEAICHLVQVCCTWIQKKHLLEFTIKAFLYSQ